MILVPICVLFFVLHPKQLECDALSLQLTSFGLHACLLGKQNHLLFRKWANEVLNNFAV